MKKLLTFAFCLSLLCAPVAQGAWKDTMGEMAKTGKEMAKTGVSCGVAVAVVAALAYKYCPAFKHRCSDRQTRDMTCTRQHCKVDCTTCKDGRLLEGK